jgi:hypothetical protein
VWWCGSDARAQPLCLRPRSKLTTRACSIWKSGISLLRSSQNHTKHGTSRWCCWTRWCVLSMCSAAQVSIILFLSVQCCHVDITQILICDWLDYDGFSVGISDLLIDKNTNQRIWDFKICESNISRESAINLLFARRRYKSSRDR